MKIIDLNGQWSFHEEGSSEWMPAEVPGCNFTDLMKNEKIENPFKGMNEDKVKWVGERNWEYTREFSMSASQMKYPQILLECEMLDTIADVYINDKLVGKSENAHIKLVMDITNFVCKLTNKIKIKFYSPIAYIESLQEKDVMPHNNNGITGVPHIRKPQCHMGWDWGPTLPISGIVKDIYIGLYGDAKIGDINIKQTHFSGNVKLNISAEIVGKSDNKTIKVVLTAPNGSVESKTVNDGECEILVKNPELWWPNDISDKERQPLYKVEVELECDGEVIEKKVKRIGLRTIKVNDSEDEYGRNFQFVVNGVAIFAKGANWIPADSFINRFDRKKCDYFITAIKNANMNMVRVWGGGYYESEDFYDLCDEYGILVWQDFAFACAPYPFYKESFLNNVKKELEYNIKRLKHRASLALWCGNNEIEMMTIGWIMKRELVKYTKIFFHDILPVEVAKYDKERAFIVGSPTSSEGFMTKVNDDSAGDTHLWHVWHGLQPLTYYRKRFTRFCSEFGLESLCDIKTIRGFAEEKDYSLKSEVFMAHQKCASGNSKMLYYMATRFRLPKKFEDIVYLSQVIQHECVKDATEHWRRNRGRCNGSLYWQLNDCWPVTSWSSIDYEGRYKALQYGARHFNAPVMVSLEDNASKVKFYIVNDKPTEFIGKLRYKVESFSGVVALEETLDIIMDGANAKKVKEVDFKKILKAVKLKENVLLAELLDEKGKVISRKSALFDAEKKLKLVDPMFSTAVKVKNGIATVTIKAQTYARFVRVDLDKTYKPFSDNYFDLLAGEEKVVTIAVGEMTEEEVKQNLSVISANTVEPKSNAFGDFLVKTKVALTPLNIANFIYYHTV